MALRVTAAGHGATIQDGGRRGLLRFGVTPAGPMDWVAMASANLVLGNAADAAAVEIGGGGLTMTCEDRPVAVAFGGGGFAWTRDGAALPQAGRVTLQPGAVLRARAGAWGAFTYLALPGGIDVRPVMGSRATHTRSGLGGLEGRMLRAGDVLPEGDPDAMPRDEGCLEAAWLARSEAPVGVVPGPQDDYFDEVALATFFDGLYALTSVADRMAYKFAGPRLAHRSDFNIVSDGVALGAVQVAGDGQPMVLMADRQPTGGYSKIGHVCRADFGRLAQVRPGEAVRFHAVDREAARVALLALEDLIATTPARCAPLLRVPTAESLLAVNLIDGVADALTPA